MYAADSNANDAPVRELPECDVESVEREIRDVLIRGCAYVPLTSMVLPCDTGDGAKTWSAYDAVSEMLSGATADSAVGMALQRAYQFSACPLMAELRQALTNEYSEIHAVSVANARNWSEQ